MNTSNPFIAFLVEIFTRISQKSPTFFIYWQWIAGAVTAVTGLPDVIDTILGALKITPPAIFVDLENKTVAICSLLVMFFALLPVQNKTVAVDTTGQELKVTDDAKMPFTAKAEAQMVNSTHPVVGLPIKKTA